MLINENTRKAGAKTILAVLVTGFLGEVFIKNLAKRTRPSRYIASGHTSSSVACAIIISSFYPCMAIPVSALAFLVSFSRLYFKVHYPSDILAGALLGLVCAIFIIKLF